MKRTILEANSKLLQKILQLNPCRKIKDNQLYFYGRIIDLDCLSNCVRYFINSNAGAVQISINHQEYSGEIHAMFDSEVIASPDKYIIFSYGTKISAQIYSKKEFDDSYQVIFNHGIKNGKGHSDRNLALHVLDSIHDGTRRAISKENGKTFYVSLFIKGRNDDFSSLEIHDNSNVIVIPNLVNCRYRDVILVCESTGEFLFEDCDTIGERYFILEPNNTNKILHG